MNKNNPIGLFDSGVGGTSIWKEVHALLPFENTIYLADSRHAPYGNRSTDEIINLSIKNVRKLLAFDCKLIVVACNTATTNAISILREQFDVPIIGIEPAIKPAALHSITKRIGILATKGTLSSTLFSKTAGNYSEYVSIVEVAGEGLVPLIEAGEFDTPEMIRLLEKLMKPMIAANVDYLVLGSTHYPHILPTLSKILPLHIKIIDSGEAVAKQTKKILQKNDLERVLKAKPELQFFTNAETSTLEVILKEYHNQVRVDFLDF